MSNTSADVYISYAGNDTGDAYENSRDEIVKKICEQLAQKNIKVKEYKTALQYKDNLQEYMLDIAYAKIIVILVSDKYLKSEYCMYEATEILNRNKREFEEKIFPVILTDADIFKQNKRLEYVLYWKAQQEELDKMLEGQDPKLFMSMFNKAKQYREYKENMDEFLERLSVMCQLPGTVLTSGNYQVVTDAIVKQIETQQALEMPVQASAVTDQNASTILYPQVLNTGNTQNVAVLSKSANDLMGKVLNKVDDIILDSENAKKDYININFDEISGDGKILPATLNFIYSLRLDKTKYEPYRQSLIISALSLGLIKKYDETKARLLIDFATDDDPVLSYRALVGVVLGLLDKEDYISDDIKRKLETLQDNVKIQRCLLIIFFLLGNVTELRTVATSLKNIEYNKFEFFDKAQHWFQPFYESNTILKENVADKKFAKGLLEAVVFLGLDSTKYALSLLYPTLDKESLVEFKNFCELDSSVANMVKNENLKQKFLLELEVSKYVLEFYIYASVHNNAALIDLIEDKEELRAGYLYKLVFNDIYQRLLQGNLFFFKKQYAEAAEAVKPVLDDQPNNIEVLLLFGTSNYYAGNYDEVIKAFEKVTAKGVKEIQLLAILGDAYFNTKNYEKAIGTYKELLELQQNVAAIVNIGRSYQLMQQPDLDAALEYYLKAYALEPGNYNNLLFIGDTYLAKTPQDFENAFPYYWQAFKINKDHIELLRVLTYCTIKLPQVEFEKCHEIYARHIELEPGNVLPYLAMGDRFVNTEPKNYLQAFEYYEKAWQIQPDNIMLVKALSDCLNNLPETSLEKFEKVYLKWIELEPGTAYPYLALGDAYINKAEDYENAFKYYYAASQLNASPKLIDSLLVIASRMENPEIEKIESLYNKYKELEPNSAAPDVMLAAFYENKKQPDLIKAEEHYTQAYAIDPLNKDLLSSFGRFYGNSQPPDYTKSSYYFNELLKQEPDDFSANFFLGWGNFVEGNYSAAKTYFGKCTSQGIDENVVYQNLAHIAFVEGDKIKAKSLYKRSYDLFTDKHQFYVSSMDDFKYLEKAGIDKNAFEQLIKEIAGE